MLQQRSTPLLAPPPDIEAAHTGSVERSGYCSCVEAANVQDESPAAVHDALCSISMVKLGVAARASTEVSPSAFYRETRDRRCVPASEGRFSALGINQYTSFTDRKASITPRAQLSFFAIATAATTHLQGALSDGD